MAMSHHNTFTEWNSHPVFDGPSVSGLLTRSCTVPGTSAGALNRVKSGKNTMRKTCSSHLFAGPK